MTAEVDTFEAQDPASRAMAAAFVRLPAHSRLYPSTVVPALLEALRAEGLLVEPLPWRTTERRVQIDQERADAIQASLTREIIEVAGEHPDVRPRSVPTMEECVEAYREGARLAEAAIDWARPFREAQAAMDAEVARQKAAQGLQEIRDAFQDPVEP